MQCGDRLRGAPNLLLLRLLVHTSHRHHRHHHHRHYIKIDWSDPSKSVPTASYPNKWPVSCYGPNIKVRTPAGGGGGSSVTTRGGPCLLTGDVSPEELAMAWCKAKTDPGACTVVPI
eukprot:COSAG01_NODE_6106_length_3848_cov_1.384102_7_plen_117_part_00